MNVRVVPGSKRSDELKPERAGVVIFEASIPISDPSTFGGGGPPEKLTRSRLEYITEI